MSERTPESVLEDIKNNPKKHRHDLGGLSRCCTIDGIIYPHLMDAHAEYVDLGTNGGRRCDVVRGPCNCGAWH